MKILGNEDFMMNHLSQIAQALPEHDLDAILITSEAG